MNFKIKHFSNLLVRFFTGDRYYICEECHKVHKRDGQEIRLELGGGKLLAHRLWYGSVSKDCYIVMKQRLSKMLKSN